MTANKYSTMSPPPWPITGAELVQVYQANPNGVNSGFGNYVMRFADFTGSSGYVLNLLTASNGGSNVGFIQNLTGAIARTLEEKSRDTVSLADFLPRAQIPLIAAGTSTFDCKSAFDAAFASGASLVLLPEGRLLASQVTQPTGVSVRGAGRGWVNGAHKGTRVVITGDGGGAVGNGVNGGWIIPGLDNTTEEFELAYNNPALQCLLNVSHATGGGRVKVRNVPLYMEAITAAQVNCVGMYIANEVATFIDGCQIGVFPNFKQQIVIRGLWNGCSIANMTFRPNTVDLVNGVYSDALPMVDINASTRASSFNNCTWENGPNGIRAVGQGEIDFYDCYLGDGPTAPYFWTPAKAMALGDYVYPSASITADATNGNPIVANASATTNLYLFQKVTVIGAGVAGANLTARITAISGTNVTLDTAPSTTVTGTGVYYGSYAGTGHRVTTAGTSGSSQPTYNTTLQGTVADGTAVLMNYGPCAWLDGGTYGGATGKSVTSFHGGFMGDNMVGVSVVRSGSLPGAFSMFGGRLTTNEIGAYVQGATSFSLHGAVINGYKNAGVIIDGAQTMSNLLIAGSAVTNRPANGADVVLKTANSGQGGMIIHDGWNITGANANRCWSLNIKGGGTINGMPSIYNANTLEGSITASTGVVSGTGNAGAGMHSIPLVVNIAGTPTVFKVLVDQ